MNKGYIKLYHSFLEWEWFTDLTVQAVFLHLLLTVSIKEVKFQGGVHVKGSRRVSIKELADELGLSIQNVRTAIAKLTASGYMKQQQANGKTTFVVPRANVNRPGSYVKLYKKFTSWEWYTSHKERSVYIYSLLLARRFITEEKGVLLKVGDYAKSFPTISKDLGLSLRAVRTAFKNLKATDDIRTVADRRTRVISICNYAIYHKYEEDPNKVATDGFDTFSEKGGNIDRLNDRLTKDISTDCVSSYELVDADANKAANNLLTNDQHSPNKLYTKSVKREREKECKTRQDNLPPTLSALHLHSSEKGLDELLWDAGHLSKSDRDYLLNEIYDKMPKKSMELFRETIKDTFGVDTHTEVAGLRDKVVIFQMEAYIDSIEVSSEEDTVNSTLRWSCFRYKSKHYKINVVQDIAAYLIYEVYTVTIPMDNTYRKRLLRFLETLNKQGIAGSELYSFLYWCQAAPLAEKCLTEDVVQSYLFNSRKLPQLIQQYFQ